MQATKLRLAVLIVAAVIVLRSPIFAQDSPCSRGSDVDVKLDYTVTAMITPHTPHPVPHTGRIRSTFEQKLADGNTIRSTSEVQEAQDSSGRRMTERQTDCTTGADGQIHPIKLVSINDPAARTSMNWTEGDEFQPKVVHVFHQPQRQPPVQRQELTPEQQEQEKKMIQAMQARAQEQSADTRPEQEQSANHRPEELGTKTIAGVSTVGFRVTNTIPAGEEGNDLPIEIVTETWLSRDLGMTLMEVRNDPRNGRMTIEYTDLQQGEPDPALFNPPAGFIAEEEKQTLSVP